MLSETVFAGTLGRERIDKDFLFQAFDDGSLNRRTRKEEVEIGWRRRRRRRRRMSQTNSGGDASLLPSPRTLSPTRKGCFCRSAAFILVLVLIT